MNALSAGAIIRQATPAASRPAGLSLGIGAALISAAVWGSALTMTRLGVSGDTPFGPADIAMMRFLLPAVILAPVFWRARTRLARVHPLLLLLMLTGGGAPFVLVAGAGLRVAAAAEAGALLPGTIPVCVAILSALLGERMGQARVLGLGLIAAAVLVIAGPAVLNGSAHAWHGHALLLAAAMLAAGYTVAMRRSGLGALDAAAFVSVASIAVLTPAYLLATAPPLLSAPLGEVLPQAAYQGLVPGLLAPLALAIAVARLGAAGATAFGALSPASAALFGAILLAETPAPETLCAIALAGIGTLLVSRR